MAQPGGTIGANTTNAYLFAGLGAFLFDMDPTTTRIGGRVGLGASFGHNLIGEATLYLSGATSTGDIRGNGLGLYVGYKFGGY